MVKVGLMCCVECERAEELYTGFEPGRYIRVRLACH